MFFGRPARQTSLDYARAQQQQAQQSPSGGARPLRASQARLIGLAPNSDSAASGLDRCSRGGSGAGLERRRRSSEQQLAASGGNDNGNYRRRPIASSDSTELSCRSPPLELASSAGGKQPTVVTQVSCQQSKANQRLPLSAAATSVANKQQISVLRSAANNYELQYEHLDTGNATKMDNKSEDNEQGADQGPEQSQTAPVGYPGAARFKARDLSYADDGIRAKQQRRRRSSGEQSAGSASVYSLESVGGGGLGVVAASGWASAALAPPGPAAVERRRRRHQRRSLSYSLAEQQEEAQDELLEAQNQHHQLKASPGGRARSWSGQQPLRYLCEPTYQSHQQSHQHRHGRLSKRPALGDRRLPSLGSSGRQSALEKRDSQLQSPPQVPQVTIIRTDSTSSHLPVLELELGGPKEEKQQLMASLSPGSTYTTTVSTSLLRAKARQQAAASSVRDQLISGQVPAIKPRLRGSSLGPSMDNLAQLIPRVRVEFYNSENTLKEQLQMYFIKDHTVSLYVRSAKLILKVLACYLYVCRVILDRGPAYANCYGCLDPNQRNSSQQQQQQQQLEQATPPTSLGPQSKFDSHPYDGPINYRAIWWVDRGPVVWHLQTSIAVICFLEAVLMQYLTYKNSIFSIVSFQFLLELVTTTPFIISIFLREWRTVFVPGFLNCWLAKQCLEAMLNDLSIVRQSSVFSHKLTILSATVFCLIFTTACGFQHTQRSGGRNYINIFESIYFVVVTFSTVGYGDFKPETWISQVLIMLMICFALIVLPSQFEQLAYFWIERKKLGASYAHHSTRHEKHVVVCSTTLRADTIMDFLNEFYAHPLLQTFSVVLLSPCELDTTMKLVLQTPNWNNRVVYIQGSALKASDLIRARMQSAEACFILAARNYNDRSAADEHTILRSWAIRDFSPYVPQYVQIFRTENKIHVAFAEHVVCDDEFKYALLANNCLIPGASTLVTLLLHTSLRHSRRRRCRRRKRGRHLFARLLASLWPGSGARRSSRGCRLSGASNPLILGGQKSAPSEQSKGQGQQQEQGGDRVEVDEACEADMEEAEEEDEDEDDEDDDDDEGTGSSGAEWRRLYGRCSANEIYHIRLSDSRFFGEYQGKSFTYASFHSHRKFGVALIGVQTDMRGTWPIMLNPGPTYLLKSGDILFYINITKEENSTLMPMLHEHKRQQHFPSLSLSPQPFTTQASQEPYIRVEASSPTVPRVNPPAEEVEMQPQATGRRHLSVEDAVVPQQVMRHSVAAGASIVARSLCSVAGIPGAGDLLQEMEPAESQRDSLAHDLHHLAAHLLSGKRNSTASASAACAPPPASSISGPTNKPGGGLAGSRNTSTLELAQLVATKGLRKGSNMSIASSKSRDASPTRLKQVVSGLAVKMKRVKLGKSLTHLTIPRMDYGGSSTSSTESFVNARGRRPSIAPVPAMMGESEEHDSDHEREQESYFAMSWTSSSESSPIVKKFVFCTTYVGVSPTLCYLLQRKKASCCLQLVNSCEHCPYKNARQYNWHNRCIILASDFASNGIYNFLVPLRAHFHNPSELRPIVLLLERKPSPQFIDAISWFPMVYWMPGSIDNLDDLIKAGINMAHSVVVTNKESTNSAEEDYLADCNTIVAVQTMFKMFPSVGIITELSQSSNMRFMQFRAHDTLFSGLSMASCYYQPATTSNSQGCANNAGAANETQPMMSEQQQQQQQQAIRNRIQLRKLHSRHHSKSLGKDVNSHAYKYRLPFAAGNVFSASMLDTLLYQAFVKDYMITMVRLLLGIDQAPGSGFLSSMRITKDELWIRTYGRLYQRLCSTTCEIPLGIYRTEPLDTARHQREGPFATQQASYEQASEELERSEITNMVKNRLQDLGMNVNDYDDSSANRNNTFSYVIINPNCDIHLREGDIIYLIRPSPIHSRKLFMHRANSVRHVEAETASAPAAGAAATTAPAKTTTTNLVQPPVLPSAPSKVPPSDLGDGYEALTTGVAAKRLPSSSQQQANSQGGGCRCGNLAGCTKPEGHLKSCLSDGDFHEILIKVNDDNAFGGQPANKPSACCHPPDHHHQREHTELSSVELGDTPSSRRRSSCSDVEEPSLK